MVLVNFRFLAMCLKITESRREWDMNANIDIGIVGVVCIKLIGNIMSVIYL